MNCSLTLTVGRLGSASSHVSLVDLALACLHRKQLVSVRFIRFIELIPLLSVRHWSSRIDTNGSNRMASNKERTFLAIKPDAVQRGLIGDIIKRFEQRGFKLIAMKMVVPSQKLLQVRYINKNLFFFWMIFYRICLHAVTSTPANFTSKSAIEVQNAL